MTEITTKGKLILGLQHVLAMFGATVLVPFLTGMNFGSSSDLHSAFLVISL